MSSNCSFCPHCGSSPRVFIFKEKESNDRKWYIVKCPDTTCNGNRRDVKSNSEELARADWETYISQIQTQDV